MHDDLIDLRSPVAGHVAAHPISVQQEEDREFSFQVPPVPQLKLPAARFCSLIDDIVPSQDQPGIPLESRPAKEQVVVPTAQFLDLTTPRRPDQDEVLHDHGAHPIIGTSPILLQAFEETETSTAQVSASVQTPEASHEASTIAVDQETAELRERQLLKELEDVKLKLAKVEASREALARDLGQQKAVASKLEGSISSYEKQIKQSMEEIATLRVRVLAAEKAAADAQSYLDVTPERCRVSAKALQEEANRADDARQQKEMELIKAQQLLDYEVQEMKSLKDFMTQERLALLRESESLTSQLRESQAAATASRRESEEVAVQLTACQEELREAKREVWALNNSAIELNAELASVKAQAAAAQGALKEAQEQAAMEVEAKQKAEAELREGMTMGVKLYKQIRAVAHALEGHQHVFQPIPKVALSIRSLQEWCGKQASYWGAQAAALDGPPVDGHTTTSVGVFGSSSGSISGGVGGSGVISPPRTVMKR